MRQYGRRYRLEIGNNKQSIVIDNLAISFNIEKTISEEPNTSKIEIYNLNANNRNQIANKIFNQVKLFAGYDEPRLIFAGQITQAYTSRNDLDFITHIECGDGLRVTCLLNPKLNIGSLVRIQSILSEYDGDYKITQLTHSGDFLNDTWQTELIAINGKFHKVEKK